MPSLKLIIKESFKKKLLNKDQKKMILKLIKKGQKHLFENWNNIYQTTAYKKKIIEPLEHFHQNYQKGLFGYLKKVKKLFLKQNQNTHFYPKKKLTVPEVIQLLKWDNHYQYYENKGKQLTNEVAFVLVAGGLGERLGYKGAKVEMPFNTYLNKSFLEHYCQMILTFENLSKKTQSSKKTFTPLIIMTSIYTHQKISLLLEKNCYYGLKKNQIWLIQQTLIPAIANLKGEIALKNKHEILMKPYGHGNVHILIHQKRYTEKLLKMGKKYLFFMQDTNAQVCNIVLPSLGVASDQKLDFLYVGVKKKIGEKMGSLVKSNQKSIINIEYNFLENFLSKNPILLKKKHQLLGNTNTFIICLNTYKKILNKSKGLTQEFINPKYKNQKKDSFEKPTRIETMMQNIVFLLPKKANSKIVQYKRKWAFSPVKNNFQKAIENMKNSKPLDNLLSAEWDSYEINATFLKKIGAAIQAKNKTKVITSFKLKNIPLVYFSPLFFKSTKNIKQRIKNLTLKEESSLIIDGNDISINTLTIDRKSSLIIKLAKGVSLKILNQTISNQGAKIVSTKTLNKETIQTHTLLNKGALVIHIQKKGNYQLNNGKVVSLNII